MSSSAGSVRLFPLKTGAALLRNVGAEAAEPISGNNQAYSFLPDIAGKSGPFVSCGRTGLDWTGVVFKVAVKTRKVAAIHIVPSTAAPRQELCICLCRAGAGGNIDRECIAIIKLSSPDNKYQDTQQPAQPESEISLRSEKILGNIIRLSQGKLH